MAVTRNKKDLGIPLNLQMICDELDDLYVLYTQQPASEALSFSGCRLFHGQQTLISDILYVVRDEDIDAFPVDQHPYITPGDRAGQAPHLRGFHITAEDILDIVLDIFERYHRFESSMNNIITGEGSLNDLCAIGCDFFRNPLYIHDSMFSVIAIPRRVKGMLDFDVNEKTGELRIPLWLVDDFKFDVDYQLTLQRREASIWGNDHFPHNIRSLYVNLWEGDYYYGRLLINEIESALKPSQFRLAEIFAEYIKLILRRDAQRANDEYQNHEHTLQRMIRRETVHPEDLNALLDTLGWHGEDRILCLKLISQDPRISVRTDSPLRSHLADAFKGSVQFFLDNSLCVLFDLRVMQTSQRAIISQLAPLIRDSYLYAGISNQVTLVPDLHYGSRQADIALEYVRKTDTMRWLFTFSDCMLDYTLSVIDREMPYHMLIPPVLFRLIRLDKTRGTRYYETLQAYILNERSIPKTSEALFVHRTTLLYRLEKLQEILRLDLNSSDVRLQLELAFRFMEASLPLPEPEE